MADTLKETLPKFKTLEEVPQALPLSMLTADNITLTGDPSTLSGEQDTLTDEQDDYTGDRDKNPDEPLTYTVHWDALILKQNAFSVVKNTLNQDCFS